MKNFYELFLTKAEVDKMRFSRVEEDLFLIEVYVSRQRFADVLSNVLGMHYPKLAREIQLALTQDKCLKCGEYRSIQRVERDTLYFVCGKCNYEWERKV